MSLSTKTSIAGVELPRYVYNASGINNEALKQLEKIGQSGSAAILLKSCTMNERKGNENPKYIVKSNLIPGCTLNSMGLPNKGLQQNLEYIKSLKESQDKPVIACFSGFSPEENWRLLEEFQKQNLADLIEINVSCPNIGHSRLLGYDIREMDRFLSGVDEISGKIPIGIKFPPFLEMWQFDEMSEILLKHKIKFITCTNTIGNCLVIDSDKEAVIIKPNSGMGGLGGDFIKPIALSNVFNFYRRLQNKISIVGVGGIRTGKDAFEFLLAGADSVQIGTAFAQEGIEIFEKVNRELEEILTSKGYKNLAEVKGKLKLL